MSNKQFDQWQQGWRLGAVGNAQWESGFVPLFAIYGKRYHATSGEYVRGWWRFGIRIWRDYRILQIRWGWGLWRANRVQR